jgi:hypothetical protein
MPLPDLNRLETCVRGLATIESGTCLHTCLWASMTTPVSRGTTDLAVDTSKYATALSLPAPVERHIPTLVAYMRTSTVTFSRKERDHCLAFSIGFDPFEDRAGNFFPSWLGDQPVAAIGELNDVSLTWSLAVLSIHGTHHGRCARPVFVRGG